MNVVLGYDGAWIDLHDCLWEGTHGITHTDTEGDVDVKAVFHASLLYK